MQRGIAKSATATLDPAASSTDHAAALAALDLREQVCRSPGRIYKRQGKLYLDAIPSGDPAVNETAMSATFWISRPIEDRSEDIVDPEGLILDNYRLNPVVFFDHAFGGLELPIGKSESPDGSLAITKSAQGVVGTCYFSQSLCEAVQIFALVQEGILRAASPFIIEKDFSIRPNTGRNKERPGLFIKVWDMAEWSIVGVPDNPEAVRKVLDRRKLAGSPIAEPILKSLRAAAAPIPAQGRGYDPAVISGGTIANAFTLASILSPRPTIMSMAKSIRKSGRAKSDDNTNKDEETKRLAKDFEDREDVKKLTKEYSDIKDSDDDKAKSRRKEIEEEYKRLRKDAGLTDDDDSIPDRPGEGRAKDAADGDGDDGVTPLGSQVLQAAHAALSEVADQMENAIKPVENPQVKEYADSLVDEMRGHMDNIDELHKSEYGEEVAKSDDEEGDGGGTDAGDGTMAKFLARAKSHRMGLRGLASQAMKLANVKSIPQKHRDDLRRISMRLSSITKAAERGGASAVPADWEKKYKDLEAKFDALTAALEKAIPHSR